MITIVAVKVLGYVSPSAEPDVPYGVQCGDTKYLYCAIGIWICRCIGRMTHSRGKVFPYCHTFTRNNGGIRCKKHYNI